MSDFTLSVDFDARQVLQGFAAMEQSARRSGENVGKSIGDGLATANANIRALSEQIKSLGQIRNTLRVDSAEYRTAQQQIDLLQLKLTQARGEKLKLQADASAVTAAASELQRVGQVGKQAGTDAGKGLSDGLSKGANKGSQDTLRELNTLKSSIIREFKNLKAQGIDPTSEAYRSLQARLAEVNQQIRSVRITPPDLPQAANGYNALNGAIQGIAFSLANTLTNAAGDALRALGTIPQQVQQFDSAKAAVRTLGVDADDLGNRMLKLSASTQGNVSAVELLKASYDVASSGFASAADSTNILAAAQDGAVGGFTDINTVADAATSVLNAYGMTSDKARKLVDGFIQTQNDGKITVGQYAQEIGRIAPVAAASGVSIDELNAAISSATAQGVPVGSTFAGMRQAISSILKPSAEASAYAQTLGLDFSASGLKAKGFGKFMEEVAQKTGGSAEAIIRLTGSVEAQAAIQPLVNDGLKKYNQFLDNQTSSAGAAGRAAADATNSIDGSLKRLANTFSNLSVQAFAGLAPVVTTVVNAVNGVLNVMLNLPGPVRAVAGVLAGLTAAYVGARTAAALFTAVLQTDQIQGAIQFFRQLGTTIANDFQVAITAARAQWTAFTASVQSQGLLATIGNIGKAFVGLAGQVAVVALRFAYIAAAIEAYQKITGAATEASQGFSDRLVETQKALDMVRGGTDNVSQANERLTQTSNGVIAFFENLPGLLRVIVAPLEGVIRLFYTAVDNFSKANAFGTITSQSQQLQSAFTEVQQAAQRTVAELRNATILTPEQQKSITDRIAGLKAIKDQADAQAQAYRDLAVAYRARGDADSAKIAEANAKNMQIEADVSNRLIGALEGIRSKTQQVAGAKAQVVPITKEQAKAEEDLNKILSEAPVRNIEAQVAVGNAMLSLTKAIGDAEQSRFAVTRSALDFELKQAQDRGASEAQIGAIKDRIAANDRAALQARYQSLIAQQSLEQAMLQLSQQKARLEADLSVQQAKVDLLKAQNELTQAQARGDQQAINVAQAQVNLQEAIVGTQQQKVDILSRTQPIEQAVARLQGETARNGLQAEAAAKGYKFAINGTLQPVSRLAELQGRVSTVTNASADDQQRYARLAEQSGVAIGRTKDGAMVLGRSQQDVNAAVQEMNRQLTTAQGNFGKTGQGASNTRSEVDGIRSGLNSAKNPADALAGAFTKTGDKAPAIAQGSRDFAAYLAKAGGFGSDIAGLNLDRKMGSVATETNRAAGAAQTFYSWLQRAADLPGARWSGGPVEAGAEYRINELGQEAFLSAGRLSMINAPANSIWRAPSDGVVIPAGVTAQLQARAAVSATGGGQAGVAELAIEVGKLRAEVGNLARRDWSVRVTQRTGPTGSQVMRTLLS